MKTIRALLMFALVFAIAPVWAQEEAPAADAAATEESAAEETTVAAASPQPADVWWGNRSISYGNYLKFDRITVTSAGPAAGPSGPVVLDTIRFDDKKKAVLSPSARAIADDAVRMLRANPAMTVQIELRSDSPRSANAVRGYLTENGIAESRITTVGAGQTAMSGSTIIIPVVAD